MVQVYRKKTHTDQYLNFESHYPLPHKLGVIRTLYDRCDNIVTDPDDVKLRGAARKPGLGEMRIP